MSQERKKGFYSAPNVPLWFTDSLAGSGGWHFPRWLRGDLPTCHRWGSALSSVCVSAAPRSQQKWSRLTAPRGPREGTHFCVVLSGHSFWEPGHRDVGKPRGPHGEVDVEGSEAADSQLTASTSASTAPPWRGVSSSTAPDQAARAAGAGSAAPGVWLQSQWLLLLAAIPTGYELSYPSGPFRQGPTAFPGLLQGTHHLSNRPAMCSVIRRPQTPPRRPATIAPLCPGSGMSSIVESRPPMYEASWASELLLGCEEGSDSQSFGHTEEPSRDMGRGARLTVTCQGSKDHRLLRFPVQPGLCPSQEPCALCPRTVASCELRASVSCTSVHSAPRGPNAGSLCVAQVVDCLPHWSTLLTQHQLSFRSSDRPPRPPTQLSLGPTSIDTPTGNWAKPGPLTPTQGFLLHTTPIECPVGLSQSPQ